MGQRSQIFVRFEKELGEKEIVARYFNWNYGERMISRVYHTIAWIKAHLELTNSDPGQYFPEPKINLDEKSFPPNVNVSFDIPLPPPTKLTISTTSLLFKI